MRHAIAHKWCFTSDSPIRHAARRAVIEALEDRRLLSAGQPDPTFGTGGLTLEDPTLVANGGAYAVAIQADGKIVSAGNTFGTDSFDSEESFHLVRYNPDGSTDTSFGVNGVVRTVFPGSLASQAYDVVIQSDGKILAAGYAQFENDGDRFAVARYLPSGKLDTSFSGDGLATVNFGAGEDRADAVAIHPGTGKIVVVGFANGVQADGDFAVARLNPNGTPDTMFNGTGRRTVDFAGTRDIGEAVLVGADGRITMGGTSGDPGAGKADFALVRLTAAGALDNTFDGDGKRTIDFAGHDDYLLDIALAPGGGIVAAGQAASDLVYFPDRPEEDAHPYYAALARFTASGALEKTFGGGDGRVIDSVGPAAGTFDSWYTLAVLGDGRIVTGGNAFDPQYNNTSWVAGRYLANGALDPSFGDFNSGISSRDFESGDSDYVEDLVVQRDGRIVLVGSRDLQHRSSTVNLDFGIRRLTADGAPDTSFGRQVASGALAGRLEGALGRIIAIATQADGKVLAVGDFSSFDDQFPDRTGYELARFLPDGTLDLSFGDKGLVRVATGPDAGNPSELDVLKVLPSGKLLVAGVIDVLGTQGILRKDFDLARLNADGTLDGSFGDHGEVTVDFGGDEIGPELATDAAGSIYLAGTSLTGPSGQPLGSAVIAKLTSAGALDRSFGSGGKKTLAAGAAVEALAVDSAGRPIAAVSGGAGRSLTRLTTNGAIDATYGAGGRADVPGPNITDLKLTADDRTVVSQGDATTLAGSPVGFIVRRYTSGGRVDTSFGGGDGLVTLAFANGGVSSAPNGRNAVAAALAIQPNGRIVVAGITASASGGAIDSIGVLRLTASGAPDTTFNAGTILLFPPYTLRHPLVSGLALGPDGKPIVSGYLEDVGVDPSGSGSIGREPFLARFQTDPGPAQLDPRYFRLDPDGTLHVTGTAGDDFITAYRNGDLLHVGESRRAGADPGYGDIPFASVKRIVVDALAGNDDVEINFNVTMPATLNGGDGDDTLVGGGGNDVMSGGAGNDKLYASPGADDMSGGAGFDTVNYGSRLKNLKVTINDNLANDGETGEGDNARSDLEVIVGGAGNDTLTGNAANNVIFGNGGDDQIHGGDGNDQLTGGPGRDALFGENGNDTLYARDGAADFLSGGPGFDTAQRNALDAVFSIEKFI